MFNPLTNNMEERRRLMESSMSKELVQENLDNCRSLEDFYYLAKRTMNGTLGLMQLFILDNYKKLPLEEWNRLGFTIRPHLGKDKMYFGKEDDFSSNWKSDYMEKRAREKWEKSIKIESISFTLDEIDGDFSVNFNDGYWSFLHGENVFEYYMVVKNYLEKK